MTADLERVQAAADRLNYQLDDVYENSKVSIDDNDDPENTENNHPRNGANDTSENVDVSYTNKSSEDPSETEDSSEDATEEDNEDVEEEFYEDYSEESGRYKGSVQPRVIAHHSQNLTERTKTRWKIKFTIFR